MKRRDPKINYRIQTLFLQGKNVPFIAKEIGMSERQIRWRIQNLKKFGPWSQGQYRVALERLQKRRTF